MLCLGRLLKTERTVVASLASLFVFPFLFLPGACSVLLGAKPRSVVGTGLPGFSFSLPFPSWGTLPQF